MNRTKSSSLKASSSSNPGSHADWFTKQISRRSLGKGLAWTAVLGMAGVTLFKFSSDKASHDVAYDSLELQRKEGWNVGSADRTLSYPAGVTNYDSKKQPWSGADPNYLISVYQPRGSQWQPFFVPPLIQSLSQPTLRSELKLLDTAAMDNAYQRAEGLRNLISQSTNANQTLIVADLPGPESVALGAALADTAQLVPVFD